MSFLVDWIEGTYKNGNRRPIPLILNEDGRECTGFHGYTSAAKYRDGRIEMWHSTRPEMGYHTQWNGTAMRSTPVDGLSLCAYLAATGFSFTRLDLAIDVIGYQFKAEHATRELKNGDYSTRAKKFPIGGDAVHPGYTQYVGKRPSEIYLCIYDKAAEMGHEKDYTRVELRCGGKRANKAAETILRGVDFRQLVLGHVRFPKWKEWNEIMVADAVTLPAEKKLSNTRRWLLEQCAPSLARELDNDENDDFWFQFLNEVNVNRG